MADEPDYTYGGRNESVSDPCNTAVAVDLSSTDVTFTDVPRCIFVGTGGNIVMKGRNGNANTWKNVPAGSIIPFRPSAIVKTNTTAADILALY